ATDHQRIIFNGNGYSEEWVKEAERRGVPNISSMVEAIPPLTTEKSVAMFETFKVFTRAELESSEEIKYENYAKAINIEARTMIGMASKLFVPACIKYTTPHAYTVIAVRDAGADASVEYDLVNEVSGYLADTKRALETFMTVTERSAAMPE